MHVKKHLLPTVESKFVLKQNTQLQKTNKNHTNSFRETNRKVRIEIMNSLWVNNRTNEEKLFEFEVPGGV